MQLNSVLTAATHRVAGGSNYLWACYPNAQMLDLSNIDNDEIATCIYNRNSLEVYELTVYVNEDDVAFRWVNPDFYAALVTESLGRGVDPVFAYDEVKFVEQDEDNILTLLNKVVHKTYVHSMPEPAAEAYKRSFDKLFENDCVGCGCDCNGDIVDDLIVSELQSYSVTITAKHMLTVKADSMEDAANQAKSFVRGLKPQYPWSQSVCWEDTYVSKEEVARELETTRIEDN